MQAYIRNNPCQLRFFVLISGDHLEADRQSCIHANSTSQNTAPMGKQLLTKPPHAIGSHLAKKSDTDEVCWKRLCMSGSDMTVKRAIKNEVVFIFNMLWWLAHETQPVFSVTGNIVFPPACINTHTMATTFWRCSTTSCSSSTSQQKDSQPICTQAAKFYTTKDCNDCYIEEPLMQPNALPFL